MLKKFSTSLSILFFLLVSYPIRLYRVISFPILRLFNISKINGKPHIARDFIAWLMLIGDIFALPEIFDITHMWISRSMQHFENHKDQLIKGLTPKTKSTASVIFGKQLNLDVCKIHYNAKRLTRSGKFAFVSFYTIHCNDKLNTDTFVHELIHLWQYQYYGSAYIAFALYAQRSEEGYNYGGVDNLINLYSNQESFTMFNFEQQGDILMDAFKTSKNKSLPEFKKEYILKVYNYFLDQMKGIKMYRWIY